MFREQISLCQASTDATKTLQLRQILATSLFSDRNSTPDDVIEAVTILEDVTKTTRRVLGSSHPSTICYQKNVNSARDCFIR